MLLLNIIFNSRYATSSLHSYTTIQHVTQRQRSSLAIHCECRCIKPLISHRTDVLSLHRTIAMAAADGRATKLSRLEAFRRRVPHVPASALGAVMKEISAVGLPDLQTRAAMREARDKLSKSDTPYGPLIQTFELTSPSGPVPVPVCHPHAMLWYATKHCNGWQTLFSNALLRHPPSADAPWNLVVYTDEITPGNALAHMLTRKCQAVYWSFLQLGSNLNSLLQRN